MPGCFDFKSYAYLKNTNNTKHPVTENSKNNILYEARILFTGKAKPYILLENPSVGRREE